MRRLTTQIAALCTVAFFATGCASLGLADDSPAPAPDKTAAATGDANDTAPADAPYGALINKQPHTLDGEIRKAQLLRAGGDFKGAIHVLAQLMLVAPDDPRIVGEYGKVLVQEGRSDDALAFLKRAVELQPDNWTFYSAQGVAYDQLSQRDKAEAAYKHALTLKPNDPSVLNNYAMSQMKGGHLAHAEDLLRKAAAHGGDYPKITANLEMIAAMRARQGGASGPESAVQPATAIASSTHVPSVKATDKPATKGAAKPVAVAKLGAPHRLGPPPKPRPKAKPRVVMQKVPYDPLAGKVYGHHGKAAVHVAAKKKPAKAQQVAEADRAPAAKPAPARRQVPALRTAADLY